MAPIGYLERLAIEVRFQETLSAKHTYVCVVVDVSAHLITHTSEHKRWGKVVDSGDWGWVSQRRN